MSKITFRADDELVSRLEALEASKSEVMREALRSYLDNADRDSTPSESSDTDEVTMDQLVTDRVDQLLAERDHLFRAEQSHPSRREPAPADITVNVSLEGASAEEVSVDQSHDAETRKTRGPDVSPSHSQTAQTEQTAQPEQPEQPEQTKQTSCTQCGETVNDNHVYCPNCGNKASHRLFCECGDEIQSDWGFCPGCGRRTPTANVLDNS